MTRTIYLVVFGNGKQPAHWAIFLPVDDAGLRGKLIHAVGNLATGFSLEFSRNYNVELTKRDYEVIALGQVEDRNVSDEPRGVTVKDGTARDRLEMHALSVVAPRATPNALAAQHDPNVKNCQWWLRQYIQLLIDQRLLHRNAMDALDSAPRYL